MSRGVSALLASTAFALTACGASDVALRPADLSDADRRTCEAFVEALPDELAGMGRREVPTSDETEGSAPVGAAYGDPAITVQCGVPVPEEFDRTQTCELANDVGWYVPTTVFDDQGADVTMTTAGYRPVVELRLPAQYRPDGPAAATAELAAAVKTHTELVEPCD
ncbi:DUF3515 domain-containing protein [Nocardioides sp. R-C-SC26]|uniref:DUF3515 domain-containing protein n=1 Tax=Nocardioides sp. R-C-SC26 TaxID=2870414 RepID=UPI001E3FAAB6|nr:DUF3515 domain-containing protein [Nocardioides sp. R-C-SC26]